MKPNKYAYMLVVNVAVVTRNYCQLGPHLFTLLVTEAMVTRKCCEVGPI